MRDFNKYLGELQVSWRADNIASLEQGSQNGVQRPWILPAALWEQGLWAELRSDGKWPVSTYLEKNQVQRHAGSHNLKSSWISGVNFYFPFGQSTHGRDMLAGFLRQHVDERIHDVQSVELEYAEEGELSPAVLLGEGGGSRGSGQTSPDIGILVNGGKGLLLVENKLSEHSFYPCSARTKKDSERRPANPDASRCNNITSVIDSAGGSCHQPVWGRKYWALLADVVNRDAIGQLQCCPAARAGYQLLRQQALAEGIARSGKYDFVVSCVALDERNETLRGSMARTGIEDVASWGQYFSGRAGFKVFAHQQWFDWVVTHDEESAWTDWRDWIRARYAMTS